MKLAGYWAKKYTWALTRRNDLDIEDLQQAACLGILQSRSAYKEERGGEVMLAGYYAQKEIRALLGISNGKLPPVIESLDKPINEETDETQLDLLADESLPETDAGLLEAEKRQIVRDAVGRLQEDQQHVVRLAYYSGMTYQQAADEMGSTKDKVEMLMHKARRNLRKDRYLKALVEVNQNTPYLMKVGVTRFNSTFTSATEEIVILRERLLQKALYAQDANNDNWKQEDNMIQYA